MQATTTQSVSSPRMGALALLAAGIFAAGAALGAVAGISLAPKAAPVAAIQASGSDISGLRLQRQGEFDAGSVPIVQGQGQTSVDPAPGEGNALRALRRGEFGGITSSNGPVSVGPRYEVTRGK